MRKLLLFLIMVLVPSLLMAQAAGGTIKRTAKKTIDTKVSKEQVIKKLISNMIVVEGGTFSMGSSSEQVLDDEKPSHQVTLNSFMIGKYEVTQKECRAVMGSDFPWQPEEGDNLPVRLSWAHCQLFIEKLSSLTGKNFRLPTEAEWEYAARGGSKSAGYKYAGSNNVDIVAWYSGNSKENLHKIGCKRPNEIGLYDMSGNASEWCSDWFGSYTSTPQNNPVGPSKPKAGAARIARGGSVCTDSIDCRNTSRGKSGYDNFYANGLRLVL